MRMSSAYILIEDLPFISKPLLSQVRLSPETETFVGVIHWLGLMKICMSTFWIAYHFVYSYLLSEVLWTK